MFTQGRITQPHGRLSVDGPERQIFGHALGVPERECEDAGHHAGAVARIVARHVELEGVNQFVAEHVIRIGQRAGHRQHDAPLDGFGHAARTLANQTVNRIGLAEVRRGRVEHDRLAAPQVV